MPRSSLYPFKFSISFNGFLPTAFISVCLSINGAKIKKTNRHLSQQPHHLSNLLFSSSLKALLQLVKTSKYFEERLEKSSAILSSEKGLKSEKYKKFGVTDFVISLKSFSKSKLLLYW